MSKPKSPLAERPAPTTTRLVTKELKVSVAMPMGTVPMIANAATVNILNDLTVILDFGFVDPAMVKQLAGDPLNQDSPPEVAASLVARVAVSLDTATQLIQNLQKVAKALSGKAKL